MSTMYESAIDDESCSVAEKNKDSHDSKLKTHIVLRNLKYDDCEAIKHTEHVISQETGRDRLQRALIIGENGEQSEDLSLVTTNMTYAALGSFMVMSYLSAQNFREDFVRKNKVTKFDTKMSATRKLQDQVLIRSGLEGARWAIRMTIFTGCFFGVSQAISVYRNKSSPVEYCIGAAVTGSVLKWNLGLRGMFAGGVIGGTMGLVVGAAFYGIRWALDETQDRRHFREVYKKQLHELQLRRATQVQS